MADRQLAEVIGKSPNAIRIKSSRLGIKKESTSFRENLGLNPIEEQVILGGLLGDLSCRITRTSKYARLEGGHGSEQKEYLLWKAKILQRLMIKVRSAAGNTSLYNSKNFKILNEYYNLFYHSGHKSINQKILDLLDDFGLLIWYLDDGSYKKRDKSSCIYTNGFSFEEQVLMKNWFNKKYGLNPAIYKNRDLKRYPSKVWYYIYFGVKDTKKLFNILKKFHVPNCMKYKLGFKDHTPSLQMKLENNVPN